MSRYVITITPDNGAQTAHTTVRVDTSTGQTRITELTVEAGSGAGLAPADLPPVDLDLLVRALTAPAPARALPSSSPAPQVHGGEPGRGQAKKTTPRASKTAAAKPAAAKKATAKKSVAGKASAVSAPAAAGSTRAYRRMPDPEQVMAAYQQTGSLAAVAEHFDVPRHTVAGWARRLRSLGHTIGRS
ncbi:helix-turn-helix domain-containing protein [Actinomycetes bacterium KLBMP 9797]